MGTMDVEFGIQIGSELAPNGTNLGLFKISFSTFWREDFVRFGANSDPIWMPNLHPCL